MADSRFLLECTPPRMPKGALVRPRLTQIWEDLRGATAIVVEAPSGFGKTTLLTQWRRLWLERGALVAWLTLDPRDDPARFAEALFAGMRGASGRKSFEVQAAQSARARDDELGALTRFLTEVARLAAPSVLLLDEAERLPEATAREALSYLIHNAPPNLHVVVGTRAPLPFATADLAAHGRLATLRAHDLRLTLDESIEVMRQRFRGGASVDDCARLHELTEGWPMGVQLAAAAIERAPDLPSAVRSLSAREGDLERYFLESLFGRLPADLAQFLERVAIVDFLEPALCDAVTGGSTAAAHLRRLTRETPIVVAGERRGASRLHPLARDFLLGRFDGLPATERHALHRRAARWLAAEGRYADAARHALAAEDGALAHDYARRSLWDLVKAGRLIEAREWLARIPATELRSDTHLMIAAAWVMALGLRPREGQRLADEIARRPDTTADVRFEALHVASAGAIFDDRAGELARVLARAPRAPRVLRDPIVAIARANHRALLALFAGDTARVRRVTRAAIASATGTPQFALSYTHCLEGVSHLWDGDAVEAEATLRPVLDTVERESGRRSMMAASLATVVAAAAYQRGHIGRAQELLANRLDVVERAGVPEVALIAYRTLAYVALAHDDERRALATLRGLYDLAAARRWPRVQVVSLAEQARIHALAAHVETTRTLIAELDAFAPTFAQDDYAPFEPHYHLHIAIAKAYAALATRELEAASRHLTEADRLAARLHRRPDALVVKVLRGIVAHERGDGGAVSLLQEAASLAALGGLERLLVDAHPLAPRLLAGAQVVRAPVAGAGARPAHSREGDASSGAGQRRVAAASAALLTPKEAEVLNLLSAGLPNKQIAMALEVSEETVKWHLKNLFSKLDTGSRRHAVDRARLLGLLAS